MANTGRIDESTLARQLTLFDTAIWPFVESQRARQAAGQPVLQPQPGHSAEETLLSAVPKQVAQADAADVQALFTLLGGAQAQDLNLTPQATSDQNRQLLQRIDELRTYGGTSEEQLRALDVLVRAQGRRGSPALLEALQHYGPEALGDGVFVLLGAWGIHDTLQAIAGAKARGEDTQASEAALVHQVAMTGSMSALLIGRVAEGVASALNAALLPALQEALRIGGSLML